MTPEQAHQADALRGIAAAAVLARRRSNDLLALQSFLCDVEHHLTSLIVLGAIPEATGRPPTVSGRDIGDGGPGLCSCDGPAHPYDRSWCGPRRIGP